MLGVQCIKQPVPGSAYLYFLDTVRTSGISGPSSRRSPHRDIHDIVLETAAQLRWRYAGRGFFTEDYAEARAARELLSYSYSSDTDGVIITSGDPSTSSSRDIVHGTSVLQSGLNTLHNRYVKCDFSTIWPELNMLLWFDTLRLTPLSLGPC